MPKLFMRDFEPHFNNDLYKVTYWNNWDRHTEAELYRGCAKKYALQMGAAITMGMMSGFLLLFLIGVWTDTTLTSFDSLLVGIILCICVGLSYFDGANRIINLYLSNLDRVQETQDIAVEDD